MKKGPPRFLDHTGHHFIGFSWPRSYYLELAKPPRSCKFGTNATKENRQCQCKCIEHQQWQLPLKSLHTNQQMALPSHALLPQTSFILLNRWTNSQYFSTDKGRNICRQNVSFKFFVKLNFGLSASLGCHIDTWLVLQKSLSTSETVSETLVVELCSLQCMLVYTLLLWANHWPLWILGWSFSWLELKNKLAQLPDYSKTIIYQHDYQYNKQYWLVGRNLTGD